MSNRKLNADKLQLLREIVAKYLSEEEGRLMEQAPEDWLSPLRRRVRDAVGQELAATGFAANLEPNERGEMLESLIDFFNRIEFGPK